MIRSLRWRLTLAIVLITFAASTLVGVGLGRFTRSEFRHFLEIETEVSGIELPSTEALVAALRAGPGEHVQEALESLSVRAGGTRMVLFSPQRVLIGDTSPVGDVVLRADGELEIRHITEGNIHEERLTVDGGIPLGGPQALGVLFVLPALDTEATLAPEIGFARRVSAAHVVGVLVATLLALVIALTLSNRIVGPVETLMAAAQRLEGGDLTQRVDVRSRDEIGELSRTFNTMAASLERQERTRRSMVSDIAHELRTPLTHLRCRIESVQDGLAAVDDALLNGLHSEIVHLGRLVDDLQELALAEAGRLQLYPVEADLEKATRQVIDALPGENRTDVRLQIGEGLPPISVDVDRYRQVVRNLLANALQHGAVDGHVVIRLLLDPSGVRCEVEDEGMGIPTDHLEHVFDRFHRIDPSRDRRTGGVGLGLAIARQLVLAWEGMIGVESEPGRGARFWFTVPRH
ncbi:MAG: ATP-binding protein [Thermoanaerobaculia bacterium]|nr:ATP-binding protein [Thermoanaerobaculia bacterium]